MQRGFAFLVVGLALTAASAVAADDAPSAWRDVVRALAVQGRSVEDLPDPLPATVVDLASGTSRAAELPRDAFLAEFAGLLGAHAHPEAGERAVGEVRHACFDVLRFCYQFHTTALGPLVGTYVDVAQPAYEAAADLAPLPVRGATAVYVQGAYTTGAHDTRAGLGGDGADRALWGAGVGSVFLVTSPWGPGMVNSFGILHAHGAFTFCATETDPDCAAP